MDPLHVMLSATLEREMALLHEEMEFTCQLRAEVVMVEKVRRSRTDFIMVVLLS